MLSRGGLICLHGNPKRKCQKNKNGETSFVLIIDIHSLLFAETKRKEKKTFPIQDSKRETNPGFFFDEKIWWKKLSKFLCFSRAYFTEKRKIEKFTMNIYNCNYLTLRHILQVLTFSHSPKLSWIFHWILRAVGQVVHGTGCFSRIHGWRDEARKCVFTCL